MSTAQFTLIPATDQTDACYELTDSNVHIQVGGSSSNESPLYLVHKETEDGCYMLVGYTTSLLKAQKLALESRSTNWMKVMHTPEEDYEG